jgi:ferritin-like metal-binding protein YciE
LNNTQFPVHHGGFLTLPWRSNVRFEPLLLPQMAHRLGFVAVDGLHWGDRYDLQRVPLDDHERWSPTMKYIWLRPAGGVPAPHEEGTPVQRTRCVFECGIANPAVVPRHVPHERSRGTGIMGLFSKDIRNMDDLFVHTLRDIYYAEKQILRALPDMIKKSNDPKLKQSFQTHLNETQGHVQRLEEVFDLHGQDVKGVDCPAIDGIIEEANDVAGEVADKTVLDAALIAAAQAVEHYEITRYGTLVAWAKELGRNDCAALLQQNLDEEKATDKKLTAMAVSNVNRRAA